MNSVFPGNAPIIERFDLKGSTVGRKASTLEKETLGNRAVLKDLDLAEEVLQSPQQQQSVVDPLEGTGHESTSAAARGFHLGATAKEALLLQLRCDVNFLRDCSVIDYSLLVGIALSADDDNNNNAGQRRLWNSMRCWLQTLLFRGQHRCRGGGTVVDGGPLSVLLGRRKGQSVTYYFGLIDFLQPYDTKKELEYHLKSFIYKRNTYSCIPPELYAQRFLSFVDQHIT